MLETEINNECLMFLNVNSESPIGWNTQIAKQFAEDILETRLDWRIEDIKYFFKFFRQRKDIPECCILGNKITADKLMQAVNAYEVERADERAKTYKTKYAEPNEPLPLSKEAIEIINEIKHRNVKPYDYTVKDYSGEDKVINDIMREFDEIFKQADTGTTIRGKRMIMINKAVMDAEQFVKWKLNINQ